MLPLRGQITRVVFQTLRLGFRSCSIRFPSRVFAFCAHEPEGLCVAKAIFIDGLVDDGGSLGLREEDDEGLLPIGHETGMHVRFYVNAAF